MKGRKKIKERDKKGRKRIKKIRVKKRGEKGKVKDIRKNEGIYILKDKEILKGR